MTAGEGPSLRWCSLLLRLLSSNLSAPQPSSCHRGSSSLCPICGTNMHTDNDTQSHVQYMYSTDADIFPPSRGALLIFCKLRGRGVGRGATYVSQMQQQLQMDSIPAYSNGLSRERYISPSPGSLFCVCRHNYDNISLQL